ncbi:hypothetical protein [Roseivirga misakiensis]|uniref:DUF4834 domain-containing protein n=1 Tax=Roseivirga misakiensis TaxID=1563681 RepID=A0A1E5T3H6_9BACT|nr:hypothetical protein [Roseivirga misakiensis]OEK05939.1 hypothetical protein BFP71_07450 [Roseivirga misakiensis]
MIFKVITFVIVLLFIFRLISQSFIGKIYRQVQEQQRNSHYDQRKSRPSGGNVNVEYAPSKKNPKSSDNFKGGDYVDYEEVD